MATHVDWIPVVAGIVVLILAALVVNQTTHTLPQSSITYTVRPTHDLAKLHSISSDNMFKSMEYFEATRLHTASKMQAFGALKYTLGCYGRAEPVLDVDVDKAWVDLSMRQYKQASDYSISVCTCVDEHVRHVFGNTLFLGQTLAMRVNNVLYSVGASNNVIHSANETDIFSLMQSMLGGTPPHSRMDANMQVRLTDDAQFERLVDIRDWCVQTAAPVYTINVAYVWNSRLLLLLGISFILVGLDLFSVRRLLPGHQNTLQWSFVWLIDMVPLAIFLVLFFIKLRDTHLLKDKSRPSFLAVFIFLIIVTTLFVLVVFSLWANFYRRGKGLYNGIWERIFVDVPMLVGLSIVGVALKLQNDEHDELVLFGTFVILLAGGLLQHISNLVKVVYDIVCARFNAPLLTALNTGAVYVVDTTDSGKLEHTRLVLQHFGWTRVYGFFAVLLCGLLSFTMSATSSLSLNPLQFITQNQYVYFVLAYVVALTGLDLFYEAIPFVTEKDTRYGEEAADRLRKLFVCLYLTFLLFSQYFVESSEK